MAVRKFLWLPAAIILLGGGILLANHLSVGRVASKVQDRNGDLVEIYAYHGYFLNPDEIVFDIREIRGTATPADVFRVFFQFASEQRDRRLGRVYLADRGTRKFSMSGADFQAIGRAYEIGHNPVRIMMEMPEKLYYPDGRKAFESWTGGWLGVMSRQAEDANRLTAEWYLDAMGRDSGY